jgi:hypothetical protein
LEVFLPEGKLKLIDDKLQLHKHPTHVKMAYIYWYAMRL